MEFGRSSKEFGPNSVSKFRATPNTGIRVRIPEFLIPGPILYIQTRCKRNSAIFFSLYLLRRLQPTDPNNSEDFFGYPILEDSYLNIGSGS
jgi:hypothetical protein